MDEITLDLNTLGELLVSFRVEVARATEEKLGPEMVTCRACGYEGEIDTYEPALSLYNDCRCPKCGSTDNQHNSDYKEALREGFERARMEAGHA